MTGRGAKVDQVLGQGNELAANVHPGLKPQGQGRGGPKRPMPPMQQAPTRQLPVSVLSPELNVQNKPGSGWDRGPGAREEARPGGVSAREGQREAPRARGSPCCPEPPARWPSFRSPCFWGLKTQLYRITTGFPSQPTS